jgi:hypothetical protein
MVHSGGLGKRHDIEETFTVRGLERPRPLWLRLVEPMTFGMRDSVVVVLVHIFQWFTF